MPKPKLDKQVIGAESFEFVSMCHQRAYNKWGHSGWLQLSASQQKAAIAVEFLHIAAGQMIDSELTRIAKGIIKSLREDE